jgi:RHS repeat-associated protein
MKTLRFFILGLLATLALTGHAQMSDPGWFQTDGSIIPAPVSIDDFVPNQSQFHANALIQLPLSVPSFPIAETNTPQIQALADGLQHDPKQIFNYVHDHIRFVLYFGAKKGAQLTLLEKSGNDFDQSALLVALLQASGYTNVQYKFGWQQMYYDDPYGEDYDLHHWWQLNLNNTNWTNTYTYLFDLVYSRGYPDAYYGADGNSFYIQRLWVALTIGGTTYQLDPAFKVSEPITTLSGFSLTNAMGGSGTTISNALLTAAGGTDNGNFAQSLSESSVRGKLTGYTTNLLNYLQSNAPNASVQQVLGGWQITPAYDPFDYSIYTTFPTYTFGGQMPILSWAYQPTNLMSTLKITFAGTNYQCYMPQLKGQRLSLTFDTTGLAQLWLDDVSLVSKSVGTSSSTTNVTIAVTHPFGQWNETNNTFLYNPTNGINTTVTNSYQSTNASYALLYAFEPDWGWLQQRENKLDTYLQQGLTNGSRQVTCETLNVMGLTWMLQTAQAGTMMASQIGISEQYFHRIGRMAQEAGHGYYVDVYMQFTGEYPNGGDDSAHIQLKNSYFDLWSFFASAFEHGIIEQLQNTNIVAASTVKMLEIANTNGQAVYLASSTNWTTGYNVQSHLTGYDSTTLSSITTKFINNGFYVLLPQSGSNHVSSVSGSWTGYGYEARQAVNGSATSSAMIIAGGYHGGYSSDPTAVVDTYTTDYTAVNTPSYFNTTPIYTPAPLTADPVDTANDTFQIENVDLSLGQAEPRGISLSRYYNGTRRFSNPAGMAAGWIHNYAITANNVAAAQAGLGDSTPAQAAPMLAATAAAISLYNGGYPNAKNWLTTSLIAKWGIDQLDKNGVSVTFGKDTMQFVQQPNGIFTPPAGSTATLTQSGSTYALQLRHGNKFNFNSGGLLTNIVDQYGQALNLTYNASNWVSTVKDWQNHHTFTFNYSGSPSRLASVSDGTRTVSYGYATTYNSQGDLTTFTDAEGKTSTYIYNTNHQITATLDAQSRLVVSNLYDSQGHITTQYTQGDTNKTWRIYWSGWQTTEFDPANGETDYFYDDSGRLTAVLDPLGFQTSTYYDGQNHIIQTASPLSEISKFIYDGNNNLIQQIDPLGFTNQLVYDAQNNPVKTIDPNGNTSTFGYNAQFSLTGSTNGAGDFVNYSYTTSGANAGTLAGKTDSGGTTTYGYDANGYLNSITYPNSLGSESFVNNSFGDVTSHVDGRGFTNTFSFNYRRQMTNSVAPTNLVTKISYDAVGNAVSATDRRGNVSSNIWSATRHLLAIKLPAMSQGTPIVTNFYDNRDLLIRSVDPLQNFTLYTNDVNGRRISQTDPVSRTTQFKYDADGRTIAITNAAGEVTKQQWNKRGQLLKLTDGAGHVSSRAFDAAGNQTILTNRNSKVWQFQFDGANRLTNTITPLGRSMSQAFNHQGLIATTKEPSGQTATYGYDGKGRLTNRTDIVATTLYRYDANDNRTNVTENGLTNSWTYDAYNRVSSYRDVYGNLIQYRYDASGNMTNLIYPGGKNVYYAYDSNNHMTNVTDWAGRKTSVAFDLNGRMTSLTRPNGTQRVVAYDAAGQPTNILEQTAIGFPIALFRFNWNNAAEMQWEFAAPLPHTNAPPARTMTYDDDNRLATVNGSGVTMDTDGNLISGPLTNGTFFAYAYDVRNRLLNAGGVTNTYDALNNRIGQTYGTNSTAFVVNPNAKLPQVLMRIKNGVTNYYIYGGGLLYQVTETATATNTLTYHFDCRGSTIALTDGNGNVTDRIEYSAYATLTYRAGTSDTPFLFNGRYGVMTDLNGLLYMQARYYNPFLCRFINSDPSGFSGGLNFYAFAAGNPVSLTDPLGLQAAGSINGVTYNPFTGQPLPTGGSIPTYGYFLNGALLGGAGAVAVTVAAPVIVAVGVPQSVVTGGLLVTGSAGAVATGYSIYNNPSPNNIAFSAGSLGGGLLVGGLSGGSISSALSPSGYQPSSGASLAADVSMAWTDANGNINPLAFLSDWLSPSATVGPMSTGPSTWGAAGTIGGAGAGMATGFNLLTGQNQVDWLGNSISSSSVGKQH